MAFTLTTTKNKRTATEKNFPNDQYELDGLWINVGVITAPSEDSEDSETRFNRLPRGIAVSDLVDHKIYASSNPEWAEEAQLVNSIMDMIREEGLKLEEGESKPINLSVQLYRRQEQITQVAPTHDDANLKSQLFG